MKRTSNDESAMIVHRWNRPPLSCQPCREKKRRCDRNLPCSNCAQRGLQCEYAGERQQPHVLDTQDASFPVRADDSPGIIKTSKASNIQRPKDTAVEGGDVLQRLRRLEEALLDKERDRGSGTRSPFEYNDARIVPALERSSLAMSFTPFRMHKPSGSGGDIALDIKPFMRYLPPIGQARELVEHFAQTLQPTMGVLHPPFTKKLMEQVYQCILNGEEPSAAGILLLFTVFAGAALAWTPEFLDIMKSSKAEAKAAFEAYNEISMAVVEYSHTWPPSVTALVAMETLTLMTASSSGYRYRTSLIRARCVAMARRLQTHRLDIEKYTEERRLSGCNFVELEMQRRVWWSMIASDWLSAFSGSPQEGAYTFHPSHMRVNYPSNVDHDSLSETEAPRDAPLSEPTSMTGFIFRFKLADLCRQVVDAMPSLLLESWESDYSVILQHDEKFQRYLNDLPVFFRLDPTSIQQSQAICLQRPKIAWQRVSIHFALHIRLCRLHRAYHIEGLTDSRYSYSRTACIRSAQIVLELRRNMDEVAGTVGLNPARFWTVMQHVFLAALVLATDVALHPNAPGAEARKAKVLTAYQTLEKSREQSMSLTEGIQKNMQTILSTLQKQQAHDPSSSSVQSSSNTVSTDFNSDEMAPPSRSLQASANSGIFEEARMSIAQMSNIDMLDWPKDDAQIGVLPPGQWSTPTESWDQLWSDFLTVAPDLDALQWGSLLDDMDFS